LTDDQAQPDDQPAYLRYYKGPVTDHFNGRHFYNPWNPRPKKGFLDMLRWRFTEERSTWPLFVKNEDQDPIEAAPENGIRVTYIGHATFLIQIDGLNILLDPVFSDRASPFASVGPKRVTRPFIGLSDLPDIHAVFVSHNHYDHMDLPSIAWLARNKKPLIITPLGNPRVMRDCSDGCRIVALDWHESFTLANSTVLTLTPSQHWSRRGMYDINRDLWGGCVLKNNGGKTLYFTGDTGFYDRLFQDIATRHGAPDIALLPIGAYEPRWFMKYAHMNPEDAVAAHKILKARQSMGFHFETFQMTNEAFDAPRKFLTEILLKEGLDSSSFIAPYPGQRLQV
jgi:L-ascorbate metabolism protein UlaG (beta-lactamase superfamily)